MDHQLLWSNAEIAEEKLNFFPLVIKIKQHFECFNVLQRISVVHFTATVSLCTLLLQATKV